jgi:hypothetical protein
MGQKPKFDPKPELNRQIGRKTKNRLKTLKLTPNPKFHSIPLLICLYDDDDDDHTLVLPLPCPVALGFAISHQFQL